MKRTNELRSRGAWLARLRTAGCHAALTAALSSYACATAQVQSLAWPDTFVTRLEALALIQTLNAEILSSQSATLTLERWCREHKLAEPPIITATQIRSVERPATAEQRQRLRVTEPDAVKHRHVQLRCGDRVLSEADNWYVPSRLTPEMNRLLETTDTPFGRAVQSLEPYRRTLAVRMLWSPLPDGWESQAHKGPSAEHRPLAIPDALFAHHALLYARDHTPFSEVDEVYQRQLLAFPPPKAR